MSRVRRLLPAIVALAIAATGAPGTAAAVPAAAVAAGLVRVALRPGRAVAVAVPTGTLLAGVTWQRGTPVVDIRRRTASGWGGWERLDSDRAADPGDEAARVRPGTEPVWLAGAVALGVRVGGPVSGARLELVSDPGPGPRASSARTTTRLRLGEVVTRAGWGADERWRQGRPERAAVTAVVLHHTVTPDDYTAAEAAGYVRAVYAYHTRSRGYDDIGYNLVVDRHGRVYEGRAGGFDHGVVGAHTAGFNTGTLGVALLGNFDAQPATEATSARVVGAVAWAADRWGFDPRAPVTLVSKGSAAHPRGARVAVRRLAGHRDLGRTACPGRHAYALLPELRAAAWRAMAAVFTSVTLTGTPVRPPRPFTVRARLDRPAAWEVTVTGPFGWVPARAEGIGAGPTLTWDGNTSAGLPAPPGDYVVTLTADDGVHGPSDPVTRRFAVTLPV